MNNKSTLYITLSLRPKAAAKKPDLYKFKVYSLKMSNIMSSLAKAYGIVFKVIKTHSE